MIFTNIDADQLNVNAELYASSYLNLQLSVIKSILDSNGRDTGDRSKGVAFKHFHNCLGYALAHITNLMKVGQIPARTHPQAVAMCLTNRVLALKQKPPTWLSDFRSEAYIRAHKRFCKYMNIDADILYRQIEMGEELTYLMIVTKSGHFANAETLARMHYLFDNGITCMNAYGDAGALGQMISLNAGTLYDFKRLV